MIGPIHGLLAPGVSVGHWTHPDAATGCTVVLPSGRARCGVDVRGGSPATRETEVLAPWRRVDRVDAVVLSGGSAYGLAAAQGAVVALAVRGQGFVTSGGVVPIVPGASVFDLVLAGRGADNVPFHPPAEAGALALRTAATAPEWGSVGAGRGATVGKLAGPDWATQGGVGSAVAWMDGDAGQITLGAVAVVNAAGDVLAVDGTVLAGTRAPDSSPDSSPGPPDWQGRVRQGENTTLVVVTTDVALDAAGCHAVARTAHDGFALSIRPSHTRYDGDTVFALSTAPEDAAPATELDVDRVVAVIPAVVAEAVRHAVVCATTVGGVPAARDL